MATANGTNTEPDDLDPVVSPPPVDNVDLKRKREGDEEQEQAVLRNVQTQRDVLDVLQQCVLPGSLFRLID